MYRPAFTQEHDLTVLHSLINRHPLATWVTLCGGDVVINHIPLMLQSDRGELGTLVGHVAKANPVWKDHDGGALSTAVFQGPQAYISPSWYPSKQEHGRVVPTWNYAVVHARGPVNIIADKQWLLNHVHQLTAQHEKGRDAPWHVADAPEDFVNKLLGGIVGIEIPICALEGKWKLGQNRSETDRGGVQQGLSADTDANARTLALLMDEYSQAARRGDGEYPE